jgi:hypothetical protein
MLYSIVLVFFFGLAVATLQTVLVYIPAQRMDERLRISRGSMFVLPVLGCTGAQCHASRPWLFEPVIIYMNACDHKVLVWILFHLWM